MPKDVRQVIQGALKGLKKQAPTNMKSPLPPQPKASFVEPERTEPDAIVHHRPGRSRAKYVEVAVSGSKGQRYRVMIPSSYVHLIPKTWEWTPERYEVANMLADRMSVKEISEATGIHRMVIYAWMEHPEFRSHVDGIIMETGMANRRERINQLSRLSDALLTKVLRELETVKLNEKSVGPLLASISQLAKHLGQEKEEFVETTKVEQQTNISGAVGVMHMDVPVSDMLERLPDDQRKELEKEFDEIGDAIIRSLTGEKTSEEPTEK